MKWFLYKDKKKKRQLLFKMFWVKYNDDTFLHRVVARSRLVCRWSWFEVDNLSPSLVVFYSWFVHCLSMYSTWLQFEVFVVTLPSFERIMDSMGLTLLMRLCYDQKRIECYWLRLIDGQTTSIETKVHPIWSMLPKASVVFPCTLHFLR